MRGAVRAEAGEDPRLTVGRWSRWSTWGVIRGAREGVRALAQPIRNWVAQADRDVKVLREEREFAPLGGCPGQTKQKRSTRCLCHLGLHAASRGEQQSRSDDTCDYHRGPSELWQRPPVDSTREVFAQKL